MSLAPPSRRLAGPTLWLARFGASDAMATGIGTPRGMHAARCKDV